MSDSPTPRTDAVRADLGKDHGDMVEHAETLERELAALRKDRDEWEVMAGQKWIDAGLTKVVEERDSARAELAALSDRVNRTEQAMEVMSKLAAELDQRLSTLIRNRCD